MTPTCERYREWLLSPDAAPDPTERVALVRHPATCPACRKLARDLLKRQTDSPASDVLSCVQGYSHMNRPDMESAVIACAVDWHALVRHVRLVPRLTSELFGAPLTGEQLARVLASGPSALSDAELIELSLNANQLIQLHEAVYGDDAHPDAPVSDLVPSAFWMGEIEKASKENRK